MGPRTQGPRAPKSQGRTEKKIREKRSNKKREKRKKKKKKSLVALSAGLAWRLRKVTENFGEKRFPQICS